VGLWLIASEFRSGSPHSTMYFMWSNWRKACMCQKLRWSCKKMLGLSWISRSLSILWGW
jgi:hypothetical protein